MQLHSERPQCRKDPVVHQGRLHLMKGLKIMGHMKDNQVQTNRMFVTIDMHKVTIIICCSKSNVQCPGVKSWLVSNSCLYDEVFNSCIEAEGRYTLQVWYLC